MGPEYRLHEDDRNTLTVATATPAAPQLCTMSAEACEDTVFDWAEDVRDYDLGDGD